MLIVLVNSIKKCLICLIDNLFIVVGDPLLIIELFIKFYLISELVHLEKLEHVMVTKFFISTNVKDSKSKLLP